MSLAEMLPLGPNGGTVIALVVGAANFLTILTVMRALSPKDLVAVRARNLARRRKELRAERLTPRRAQREHSLVAAKRMLARLKLDRSVEAKKAADMLTQAGWRSPDATTIFLTVRLVSPLALGLAAYMLAPYLAKDGGMAVRGLIGVAGIAVGVYLPILLVKNAIERRGLKLQKGLPDALDLFVICAEAGLSLDASLARVAREIGGGNAELADELGLTAIELSFLPNRRDALMNFSKRVALPSVRGLVNTLIQTEKYGTPLAHALRVLSAEFRDTRMMKAEEKAARLPATLTIPMILFILPALFVVLLGPAIIQGLKAMN
ncbi:type II secretion system F family protein [Phenylobacterium sp.]|jgi:tight adherence protein C|uniref:type II secretion system F family protein n=1 Tax=Phenylobacterium sp. TaxID=1871053 RepID=UPI002F95DDDF